MSLEKGRELPDKKVQIMYLKKMGLHGAVYKAICVGVTVTEIKFTAARCVFA